MTCSNAGQVFAPGSLSLGTTASGESYGAYSQYYVDRRAQQFLVTFGGDCATVKAGLAAEPFANVFGRISDGGTINQITWADLTQDPNVDGGATLTVEMFTGTGVLQFVNNGTTHAQTVTASGAPITWPLVIGVNCINFTFGTTNSHPGDTFPMWNDAPIVPRLQSINFDSWWCCASASFNCCGGAALPVGSFLLPTSSNPDPVAAQSTSPILNTPLYLSNHTFALPNNFGSNK